MEKERSPAVRPPGEDDQATQLFGGSTETTEEEQSVEEAPEANPPAKEAGKPVKSGTTTQVGSKNAGATHIAGKGTARTNVGSPAPASTQGPGGVQGGTSPAALDAGQVQASEKARPRRDGRGLQGRTHRHP